MSRPSPEEIGCVIVAYRRPDQLRRLLDRLDDPRLAVVVVDVTADPEVGRVCSTRSGTVRVPIEVNVGFAAAVNAGARACQRDHLVFSNDDVEYGPDEVLALVEGLAHADVVLPGIVDEDGRRALTVRALATPWTLLWEWALLPDRPLPGPGRRLPVQKWRAPSVPERVPAASAAVVALRRSLLLDLPLPEQYFLYWEELDWFWRLRQRHARVVLDPRVEVLHRGGRDTVTVQKAELLAANAVRCVEATQGPRAGRVAAAVVLVWTARLYALDRLLGRSERLPARRAGLRAALAAARSRFRGGRAR